MTPAVPLIEILSAGFQVAGACALFVAAIAAGEQACQRVNARVVVRNEIRQLQRSTTA